jgi:hypothetical protein
MLISGMLATLSHEGQTAASSRLAMGRNSSKTAWQSLQRYSYNGMGYRVRRPGVERTAELDLRTSVRYDRLMRSRPYELQLPFDDGAATGLARLRIDHLRALGGVEPAELVRLARGFPSLRAIYAATEAELASVVGAVAAARIRWFLDAPLDTRLAVEPDAPSSVSLRTAA